MFIFQLLLIQEQGVLVVDISTEMEVTSLPYCIL